VEEAIKYYAEDHVIAELGTTGFTMRGGIGSSGSRSVITANSIIAVAGKVLPYDGQARFRLPKRANRMLFQRDRHTCAYCGEQLPESGLTREHVIPRAQKGKDIWENVVSACSACNGRKKARTPEQANMPLLYLPYAPSPYEHMILLGRNVLADQMAFLLENVPKQSRLHG
jgi:hypothetical protein